MMIKTAIKIELLVLAMVLSYNSQASPTLRLEPSSIQWGQSAVLALELEMTVDMASPNQSPEIAGKLPDTVELIPLGWEEQRFRWRVWPSAPGNWSVPPIRWQEQQITAEGLSLRVDSPLSAEELASLQLHEPEAAMSLKNPLHSRTLWGMLATLVAAVVAGLALLTWNRRKPPAPQPTDPAKFALEELRRVSQTSSAAEDPKGVYFLQVSTVLLTFLEVKYDIPARSATISELIQHLAINTPWKEEDRNTLIDWLNRIEAHHYGGEPLAEKERPRWRQQVREWIENAPEPKHQSQNEGLGMASGPSSLGLQTANVDFSSTNRDPSVQSQSTRGQPTPKSTEENAL